MSATKRTRHASLFAGALIAATCSTLPGLGLAATQTTAWRDAETGTSAGQLDVPLNKSQMLTVDQPVGRVMVGNAEIADIMPITTKSIYVLGKKLGTTSLTVFDKSDRVMAVVDVAVGPDIVSLRRQIGELLPGEKIGASISNDAIVLTGVASSAPAIDRAVQLAKTFAGDKVVNMVSIGASQQVMLEVRFAEVSREAGKQLGLGGFIAGKNFQGVFGNGSQLVPDPDTSEGLLRRSAITDTFGVFRQLLNLGDVQVELQLDALEKKGLLKTLAQPTLISLSGETASFLAGGEFPIPVVQSGSGGGVGGTAQISVEFKPFGVSLAFTPTVLADGVISLSVEPEVSAIDQTSAVQVNGLFIPGLRTRRASTVLELHDGEAFAIAGLMQKDFGTNVRQLPVLGSLPILGTLFRSSGFERGETELVIVVIPRLVKPMKAGQVSLPTDRVEDAREGDLFLMGRTDGAVPLIQTDDRPASTTGGKKGDGYEY